MGSLYLPEAQDDEVARNEFLNYSVSSTSAELGATLEETFYYNPFMSGMRNLALRQAQKTGEMINKEDWKNSEDYRDGLNYPEAGFTKAAAMFIADRFDERKERQETFSRGRGGFAMGAAKFGVALVGSALDPLNVGASFLPGAAVRTFVNARRAAKAGETVTKARIAKESAFQTGTTKKRFLVGAGEGIAGAALVEPIILNTAELEQDNDYTLLDSFLNATIGGLLGGGLHVVGGKFSDRLQKARKETIETAIKTAVAQRVSGKPVRIDSILEADSNWRKRKYQQDEEPIIVDMEDPKAVTRTLDDMDNEFKLDIPLKGVKFPESIKPSLPEPKSLATWVRNNANRFSSDDSNISELLTKLSVKEVGQLKKKGGRSIDDLSREAADLGYFNKEPTIDEFIEALVEDINGNRKWRDQDLETVDIYNEAIELKKLANEFGINYKGMSEEDFMRSINQNKQANDYESMLNDSDVDGLDGNSYDDVMSQADADYNNYKDDMVDYPETDIFSEVAPVSRDLDLKELDIEHQQLLNEVDHYEKINLITEDDAEKIKIANEDVQRAETSFQSAAEAAARCLVR
jgi:hypothetical protein